MARELTRKQREFAAAYVEEGVGVRAAMRAYNTDYNSAAVIASQNL